MGKKPIVDHMQYLKFGFVVTRCQIFRCPACENVLNAGPNYQPRRCENCGQKLDFSGIEYEEEESLGYIMRKEHKHDGI